MLRSPRTILSDLASLAIASAVVFGCDSSAVLPRPAMPVRVTLETHLPETLELGVHLRLENLLEEAITVAVDIDSESLRNDPGRDDLSIHPIFRGDGPVQVTLAPKGMIDYWFSRGQLSPEDPIVITHLSYAAQLVRVPADTGRGTVEAIAIGPVE